MTVAKPKDIEAYCTWLKDEHGLEIDDRIRNRYRTILSTVKRDLQASPLWQEFASTLPDLDARYTISTQYPLLMRQGPPELVEKPFDSFLDKTFRKNVILNRNWPDPPNAGWLLPDTWYSRISDTVRTCIVVKYLDGVRFLADYLRQLCANHQAHHEEHFEAREDGYYAAHVYVSLNYEIPTPLWDTQRMQIAAELQITTQVQEVIRQLLHGYYQKGRSAPHAKTEKWQWDYTSGEFVPAYLGHILHYVEGMIMEVRDKQRGEV